MKTHTTLLNSLDRVMRLLRRNSARTLKDKQNIRRGRGRGAYRLLQSILNQPDISSRQLADLLGMRTSSLNERLAIFEEEGLIKRYKNPADQRIILLSITDQGKARVEEMSELRQGLESEIASVLSPEEIAEFTRLAQKLGDGLEHRAEDA